MTLSSDVAALATSVERAHFAAHPVDASFCGIGGYDFMLPPAGTDALRSEKQRLGELEAALAVLPRERDSELDVASRSDLRHLRALAAHERMQFERRHRFDNPAWYTGEFAFSLLSLVLPNTVPRDERALAARIAAAPDFFSAGRDRLGEVALPRDWSERARLEARAIIRIFDRIEDEADSANASASNAISAEARANDLMLPQGFVRPAASQLAAARESLAHFVRALDDSPDRSPACGRADLDMLVRDVHGFSSDSRTLEREAADAFAAALDELHELASHLDPARTWREQLDALAARGPAPGDVLETYRDADARARRLGDQLVPVADEYALEYRPLPTWAQPLAGDLYFLFYRAPAAFAPGTGSVYFVGPSNGAPEDVARAHNFAAVKEVHAVHHGSVGHHTQNAFARASASRFARFAGNDCASGIALLASGTMVEGWPTYVEDALDEIPDFYSEAERLQLAHSRLRLAATALGDLRLHAEVWTLDEMRRFYREDAAFAPARVWSETTRNSIYPGSRVMYWAGNREIRRLRARAIVTAREFHGALLAFGHVALPWAGDELVRANIVR